MRLIEALEARLDQETAAGTLLGWRLGDVSLLGHQRLYRVVDGQLEPRAIRWVDERAQVVEIYVTVGDRVGSGSAQLGPGVEVDEIFEVVYASALSATSKAWTLPGPPEAPYLDVQTADPDIVADPEAVAIQIEQAICDELRKADGIVANSVEVYIERSHRTRWTHSGVRYSVARTSVQLDLAVEPLPLPNDQEVHVEVASVDVAGLELPVLMASCREEAQSLGIASLPPTTRSTPVLLGAEATAELFTALAKLLDAERELDGRPVLKIGDGVATGAAVSDHITLKLDPTIDHMQLSGPATGEGQVPQAAMMIDSGTVVCQVVRDRSAQYLERTPNHVMGNILVEPGERSLASIRAAGCIEVVRFLSLTVDQDRLTWSGEIKLGRVHEDGEVSPIKGGLVSGAFRDNLVDCYLSSDVIRISRPASPGRDQLGYLGPAGVLMRKGVAVTGA